MMPPYSVLACRSCRGPLSHDPIAGVYTCTNSHRYTLNDGVLTYGDLGFISHIPEKAIRDRQASGYLRHSKFPTQISRVEEFIDEYSGLAGGDIALDLGCGPGPYTRLLADRGLAVLGVDFSDVSLRVNAEHVGVRNRVGYVQADLNDFFVQPDSVSVLLMADFIQHLGGFEKQKTFLERALSGLRRGGVFYLSFFNANAKNRLKDDLEGSWCDGQIAYRRSTPNDIKRALPGTVRVLREYPMNISHNAVLDRWLSRIPMARHLSRMYVLVGQRTH